MNAPVEPESPELKTDDPEPSPPVEPPLEACCNSGCELCVLDVYTQDLQAWRQRHQAWALRQKS